MFFLEIIFLKLPWAKKMLAITVYSLIFDATLFYIP